MTQTFAKNGMATIPLQAVVGSKLTITIPVTAICPNCPSLLEALRDIQRDVDMGNPSYARAWRIAEDAIAAAEGRVT